MAQMAAVHNPLRNSSSKRAPKCYQESSSISIPSFLLQPASAHHAEVPDVLAFSFSSIFLRAAKIISSRRRCRFACRSFLSCDHAFCFGCCSDVDVSGVDASFDARLYRVIRSGGDGFAGGVAVREVGLERGSGGLKDGGGWNAS